MNDANRPPRDVLIPSVLSVSPRVSYTVENDYAQWRDVDPRRLWIAAEGQEWLKLRENGHTIEEIDTRANADGLRYRRGAIEMFFLLADSALESGWQRAFDDAMIGFPTRTTITRTSVIHHPSETP